MTITEALKISDIVRRKDKPSHVGSNGDGWVHIDMLLGQCWASSAPNRLDAYNFLALQKEDLLADDWEVREDEFKDVN